jgi:nucleoside-diphosphate-sugar epimerase
MDRVIAAYGQQVGLRYSCFRPFNWIGPKLDDIYAAKEGSSRVLTQFIVNLVTGEPILLVDGGEQKRCFTWVEDGIDGLMRIIENPGGACDGEIFNLGNPHNECSVTDLAKKLAAIHDAHRDVLPDFKPAKVESVSAEGYFGKGYQDVVARKPAIDKARRLLGWNPTTTLDEALERTYDAFLEDWLRSVPSAEEEPESSDHRVAVPRR